MTRQIFLIGLVAFGVAACSTPQQTRTAPLDMQAVNEYNNKVYSRNTVPQEQRLKNQKQTELPLNSSDYEPKVKSNDQIQPRIILAPHISYSSYGYHRYGYQGYVYDYW